MCLFGYLHIAYIHYYEGFSRIIYVIIDKPKQFLCDELRRIRKAKGTKLGVADFLDAGNAAALYSTLDPTSRGNVTDAQYTQSRLFLSQRATSRGNVVETIWLATSSGLTILFLITNPVNFVECAGKISQTHRCS